MSEGSEALSDAKRLTEWVRDHGRAVYGYLFALTRRSDLAEDLAQEVFRRAWQARERYCEVGAPRAYLLRIADRVAIDDSRRKRREIHLDEEGWRLHQPSSQEAPPDGPLHLSESIERLEESLQSLSPPQRRVLLMRYFGGLEFEVIAKEMAAPLGTVLSHCHRGLARLRKRLVESES